MVMGDNDKQLNCMSAPRRWVGVRVYVSCCVLCHEKNKICHQWLTCEVGICRFCAAGGVPDRSNNQRHGGCISWLGHKFHQFVHVFHAPLAHAVWCALLLARADCLLRWCIPHPLPPRSMLCPMPAFRGTRSKPTQQRRSYRQQTRPTAAPPP